MARRKRGSLHEENAQKVELSQVLPERIEEYQNQLRSMDEKKFWETWYNWTSYMVVEGDGGFSESTLYYDNRTKQAVASIAKAIAALSFLDRGVTLFGRRWEAHRNENAVVSCEPTSSSSGHNPELHKNQEAV